MNFSRCYTTNRKITSARKKNWKLPKTNATISGKGTYYICQYVLTSTITLTNYYYYCYSTTTSISTSITTYITTTYTTTTTSILYYHLYTLGGVEVMSSSSSLIIITHHHHHHLIRYDVIVLELDEMVAEGYFIPGKKTTEKIKLKAKPPGI